MYNRVRRVEAGMRKSNDIYDVFVCPANRLTHDVNSNYTRLPSQSLSRAISLAELTYSMNESCLDWRKEEMFIIS